MDKVTFTSEGIKCAALLGVPNGGGEHRHPAVVLGHGFGVRKESLIEHVRHLTAAGFVTLAIDYRTVGESGGEPRVSLIPHDHVEDFRNAISWLQGRDDVDPQRIGIWGTSFGGGVVMMTAARDRRVKAVVAAAPIVNGRRWIESLWGGARFSELRELVDRDRVQRYPSGEGGRIVIAGSEMPAVLYADERTLRQDKRSQEQGGRPLLESSYDMTLASLEKVLEWEPDRFIELISPTPLLIVTPGKWDVMHRYEDIRAAYREAGEPKRIVLLPCEQMDIYVPPFLTQALDETVAWFRQHMSEGG